jgi:hypothetical protein
MSTLNGYRRRTPIIGGDSHFIFLNKKWNGYIFEIIQNKITLYNI